MAIFDELIGPRAGLQRAAADKAEEQQVHLLFRFDFFIRRLDCDILSYFALLRAATSGFHGEQMREQNSPLIRLKSKKKIFETWMKMEEEEDHSLSVEQTEVGLPMFNNFSRLPEKGREVVGEHDVLLERQNVVVIVATDVLKRWPIIAFF